MFKFRMRVTAGELVGIGPGKVALLEAMMRTGSITAAAKELDMSYRRAWTLVDELNRALAKPAVMSATGGQMGGGSEVTPVGQKLVMLYRSIEAQALKTCKADIAKLMRLMAH